MVSWLVSRLIQSVANKAQVPDPETVEKTTAVVTIGEAAEEQTAEETTGVEEMTDGVREWEGLQETGEHIRRRGEAETKGELKWNVMIKPVWHWMRSISMCDETKCGYDWYSNHCLLMTAV